jgi:cytochrome c553
MTCRIGCGRDLPDRIHQLLGQHRRAEGVDHHHARGRHDEGGVGDEVAVRPRAERGLALHEPHTVGDRLARNLAATCANCHGTNGRMSARRHEAAGGACRPTAGRMVADFKSGAQPATIMHQIAKGYTDEQMRLMAGLLRRPAGQK